KGRRTTGHDAVATIRLSSELRESVDAWAAKQSDKPARPEAILRLVELGLKTTHRRESVPNRAVKASEMAAQEVDRISDPSATEEERQLRKRRLIKGPKEFRDIRKKSREDLQQWSDIQPGGGQVIRRPFNRRPCRAVNRVRFANEDPARVALQRAVARAGLGNPHKAAGRTPPANTLGAVNIPHGTSSTNSPYGHQESLR